MESLVLAGILPASATYDFLVKNPTTGLVETVSTTTAIAHTHSIGNSAGTSQFTFGVGDMVRMEGTGNTNVLFDAPTKKITVNSIGVTTFAASNLSPLFTTSVSNATTTPTLSFALSNAASTTVFGNFTNASAGPAFNQATADGQILVRRSGVLTFGTLVSSDLPETDPIANAKTITLNAGAGISITGTAGQTLGSNPSWTIASSITQYTDEQAQDAVGNILTDSSSIDFTYNDAGNTITATIIDSYVRGLFSAGAGISYNSTTGVISSTITQYTDENAQDAVGGILTDSSSIDFTYNDAGNTITAVVIDSYIRGLFSAGAGISYNSTTGVISSTITQYTDEMAQDTIAALIQNGTGITWSYNDALNTLTPTVTITQYTDENAQDAVGTILTDSSSIDFTYNDAGNTITAVIIDSYVRGLFSAGAGISYNSTTGVISSTITQYTDENAQDAVGTILTDSSSIDFTYNDAGNTITAVVIDSYIRGLISVTNVGTSGNATYTASTGVINIPNYTYTLPIASATVLGGIKVGSGLAIDGTGVLSASTGTVTTFSAGNLSPLFTTSVSNASTTPSLTFALTNAAANTYFGNATGSSAAPSFTAAGALTRTNDTNVTLTLGGSPTVSLLAATSLTLGWSGQLAIARGGTNAATANDALNNLLPTQTGHANQLLVTDGTNTSWSAGSGWIINQFTSAQNPADFWISGRGRTDTYFNVNSAATNSRISASNTNNNTYQHAIQGDNTVVLSNTQQNGGLVGSLTTSNSSSFTQSTNYAAYGVYGQLSYSATAPITMFGGDLSIQSGILGLFVFNQGSGNNVTGGIPAAFRSIGYFAGAGNITSAAGYIVTVPLQLPGGTTFSGTLTNYYGLYISDLSSSGITSLITNKFSIYQNGINDTNHFKGNIQFNKLIGGTTMNLALDTSGNVITSTLITNTNQLTNGANFITLASISATAPITYNNATGVISTSMNTAKLIGRTTAGTGIMEEITVGSGLSLSGGTLTSTGSGGSVTTVSVVSANGFAGTVANASTTPAITLTTSISGVLFGNGTAISAASSANIITALGYTPYNATNPNGYTSNTGTVTSVAATVTASTALSISGSPVTTSGTLAFTWTGSSSQYILGDGTLATKITNNNQLTNGAGYITSFSETDTLSTVTGRGNTSSSGINLTENGNGAASYAVYLKRNTDTSPAGFFIRARNAAENSDIFYVQVDGTMFATSFIKNGGTSSQFLKADGSVDSTSYYAASNPSGFITASSSNTLTNKSGNISQWTNDSGYITSASLPTVNNGTLTLNVSGAGLSGSQTFTANQSSNATFTVTSNATSANTASAIVSRDANGDFNARYINVSYFNSSDDTSSTGLTYIMAKFGDNYIRSASAAKVQAFLGLGSLAYSNATIPTATSQLTNDSGFITASSSNTLTNKSGNISQWTNDVGYLTSAANYYATSVSQSTNGTISIVVTGYGTISSSAASGTWGINITGNSATTSQTTFARVNTAAINYGSYGSIGVSGNTNGWAGISFSDYSTTMMINANGWGKYNTDNTWEVYWASGVLTNGTVPWARLSGVPTIPTNTSQLTNDSGFITASSSNTLTNKAGNISQWTNDSGYITSSSIGNGTLTLNVSGSGLSGSQSFTANQSGNATFTVTSNATTSATASTIAYRDGNGYLFATYFNTTATSGESSTPAVLYGGYGGDGYIRPFTSAAVRTYLGSGTQSSSTFLRGDGTWATPSGTGLTGSGTNLMHARWNGSSALTDSIFYDNGTEASIAYGANALSNCRLLIKGIGTGSGTYNIVGYNSSNTAIWSVTDNGLLTVVAGFESSDLRKKNVITRHSAVDFDMIEFTWKEGNQEEIHFGYGAQEVEPKFPYQVLYDGAGMRSLNYTEIHTYKIYKVETRLDVVEAEVAALKVENEYLKTIIKNIN